MKYRRKPTFVEAEQWFPGKDVPGVFLHQPPDAVIGGRGHGEQRFAQEPYHAVRTIHGDVIRLEASDWVILEPDHAQVHADGVPRAYPCKPSVFEATYERAGP